MREPDFHAIGAQLLKGGIASRHAHRAVNELRDHYDDLVDAQVDSGAHSDCARSVAAQRIGASDEFVMQMLSRRELKTWAFRYPRVALVFYPLACAVTLPALPVFAGVSHASSLARWGASLLLAGVVTATMLLGMQLSIVLG